MEEEFYKFVTPAEIAKDLNLPKELATKIHKYWALKRKVLLLSKVYFFYWVSFSDYTHTTKFFGLSGTRRYSSSATHPPTTGKTLRETGEK